MTITCHERNLRLQIHPDSLIHIQPRDSCHEHVRSRLELNIPVQEQNLMIVTHHDVL